MTKHESTTTEQKIEDFAEDLGRILGTARAKAEGWLGQRQAIAKHLNEIRETASKLLTDLGHEAQRVARRGRPAGSGRGPGRPKRGPGRPSSPRWPAPHLFRVAGSSPFRPVRQTTIHPQPPRNGCRVTPVTTRLE